MSDERTRPDQYHVGSVGRDLPTVPIGLGTMPRTTLLLLVLLLLAACGRGEIAPSTPIQVTSIANAPTATPAPEMTSAAAQPTEASAQTALTGDVAAGDALFHQYLEGANFACSTCHNTATADRLVGPGLLGIGETAASRVPGEDALTYLHNAIVAPSAFVVETYPDQLMPQNYGDLLTEQQIADLIAYLMSL